MANPFIDVSLIIVLAAALGIFAYILKQPTIVAYLGTGVIVSLFGVLHLNSKSVLDVMATFGVTFLLFLVGLEMRFSELKSVGKTIILTGLGQILFTALVGFGIIRLLGFSVREAIYIAVALTFSSTIIVVKLLSEKKDLQSLYGKIVVGFLLLQDFVAMIILIVLAGIQQSSGSSIDAATLGLVLLKGVVLFGGTIWLSKRIIPAYTDKIAHQQELLFISSIAWAFGIALLVSSPLVGFSIEIGGFLAGLALAQSAEQFQINARIRPLRDFFIMIFFIVLGSSLVISNISPIIVPVIILSVFVLIGNPLIVLSIMGFLGYRKRTSFFASVTVAQISEFSFILMAMALGLGYVSNQSVVLVTMVGIITIIVSTYMISKSEILYRWISPFIKIFEKHKPIETIESHAHRTHSIILIGAHRLGQYLLKGLDKDSVVIVEFDPTLCDQLRAQGYHVVFGDISDSEVMKALEMENAEIVISTVPNVEENIGILQTVAMIEKNKQPFVVVNAQYEWETKKYYQLGADYVLYPYFVGALHLRQLFRKGSWDKRVASRLRKHDLGILRTN